MAFRPTPSTGKTGRRSPESNGKQASGPLVDPHARTPIKQGGSRHVGTIPVQPVPEPMLLDRNPGYESGRK